MTISETLPHLCSICREYVPLEKCKTDERGNALHEECYVLRKVRPKILSGWKDIANHLRKGVRTVQRYEREAGLPIRRLTRKSRGAVTATNIDLDGWVSDRPARIHSTLEFTPVAQRANQLKADFLRIDSQVGLTFSGIALTSSDPEKRERTTLTARKAYNCIMRLRQDVDLSDVERNKLDANVAQLKSELQRLGQSF